MTLNNTIKACGLDYKACAILLKISPETVRSMCMGRRKVKVEHLEKLSALRLKQMKLSRFMTLLWREKRKPKRFTIPTIKTDEEAMKQGWPSANAYSIVLGMVQCNILPSIVIEK